MALALRWVGRVGVDSSDNGTSSRSVGMVRGSVRCILLLAGQACQRGQGHFIVYFRKVGGICRLIIKAIGPRV
jgi:hypothetical protein